MTLPVAHFTFDAASGDETDTISGIVLSQVGTVGAGPGIIGGCRSNTGPAAANYLLGTSGLTALATTASGKFEVNGWVRFDSRAANLNAMDWHTSQSNIFAGIGYSNTGSSITMDVCGVSKFPTDIVAGTWYNYSVGYDGANIFGYLNNVQQFRTPLANPGAVTSNGVAFLSLAEIPFSPYLNGAVDDTTFYLDVLTPIQRACLFSGKSAQCWLSVPFPTNLAPHRRSGII